MTVEITKLTGTRVEFIQDGKANSWSGQTAGAAAADLRGMATLMTKRANELLDRAEVMNAVAEVKERQDTVNRSNAKTQRRERSAATRARNADPFGFEALRAASPLTTPGGS